MRDADIREPLFDYLDERYGKNRVFEEKMIGQSRADIIMIIENEFIGLEIKSDADTYARLERQIADYDNYCDKNYVVVGKSHEKHVEEHIPSYWGILCAYEDESGDTRIKEIRKPAQSPKATINMQIQLLWRPEIALIQEKYSFPKYAGKSKKFVMDYLIEKLEEEELKSYIIELLFERDYDKMLEEIKTFKKQKRANRRNVGAKRGAKRARRAMK